MQKEGMGLRSLDCPAGVVANSVPIRILGNRVLGSRDPSLAC